MHRRGPSAEVGQLIPRRRTMSVEENKRAMRRIPMEVFNQWKLEVLDEVVAPDYIEHVAIPGLPSGITGLKLFVQGLRAAFPDFQYTLEEEVGEGDRIVQRLTARATHQGEFMGIPATGKQATWPEIHIARVQDGKL